jgi:hypothetical protein
MIINDFLHVPWFTINITISPYLDQISHSSRHFRGALRALYLVLHHREEGCVHRPGRFGVGEVGSGEGDLPIFQISMGF